MKTGKRGKQDKDVAEIKRAIKAMQAISNPVDIAALVKFFGPIIARLVARYTARYIAAKLGKRLKKNVPQETADWASDKIVAILAQTK